MRSRAPYKIALVATITVLTVMVTGGQGMAAETNKWLASKDNGDGASAKVKWDWNENTNGTYTDLTNIVYQVTDTESDGRTAQARLEVAFAESSLSGPETRHDGNKENHKGAGTTVSFPRGAGVTSNSSDEFSYENFPIAWVRLKVCTVYDNSPNNCSESKKVYPPGD